ncbi:hypothetical protein HYS91_03780 [Candidatus Daviesbacteria bacterium]|nr:hypothetical protein [Candidatus Daviesbacteria bacterium]
MKSKLIEFFLEAFPFLIIFYGSLFFPTDKDLGWHLKYGEYFFRNGTILRDNIFSKLMADYKWANPSVGVDLISFIIFNNFGFLGLMVLSALIVTATFFFFAKAANLNFWDKAFIFPIVFYLEHPINGVSFRGQQLSLLFISILFFLVQKYGENKSKKLLLILPLFILWPNIHGQFIFGLSIFSLWIFSKSIIDFIKTKLDVFLTLKNNLYYFFLFAFSVLLTLLNPFGIFIYSEPLGHLGDPKLKYVVEWLPFDPQTTLWWNNMIIFVVVTSLLTYLYLSKKLLEYFFPSITISLLLIMSFQIRRYAWSAYYFLIPILKTITDLIRSTSTKVNYIYAFFILVIFSLQILIYKNPLNFFNNLTWDRYCMDSGCSSKALEYVLTNKLTDNLFTIYDWGGFIIWNFPQIKPTIDGRMHLWTDKSGYSGFEDYYGYEQNNKDINESKYDVALVSPEKNIYNRLTKLTDERKWRLAYKDKFAAVFVRIKR